MSICPNCKDHPATTEHAKIQWITGINGTAGIILDKDGLNDYKAANRAATGTCKVCGCWETLEGGRIVGSRYDSSKEDKGEQNVF